MPTTTIVRPLDDQTREVSLVTGSSAGTGAAESELPRVSEVDVKAPLENKAKKKSFVMKVLEAEDHRSSVRSRH